MAEARTAAALVIGNELLSGKIADDNVVVLARTLRGIGVRLERVVMVLDDLDVIAADVRALSESYDVVFTSGGVGPTHDDLTVDAIAAAFDNRPTNIATRKLPETSETTPIVYGPSASPMNVMTSR